MPSHVTHTKLNSQPLYLGIKILLRSWYSVAAAVAARHHRSRQFERVEAYRSGTSRALAVWDDNGDSSPLSLVMVEPVLLERVFSLYEK